MNLFNPAVDVEPPSVDADGFDLVGLAISVLEFVGRHPVPFVMLVLSAILIRWLSKPFMKGIIIGCLIATIIAFALGG